MKQPAKTILYVDIDAFFPSVEQVKFPSLRGRPVIVGSGVAASSSYEARNYGIKPGTPITTAMELCPGITVLKGHQPTYRAFAEKIFDCCQKLSPVVETYLDEAFCDLTGTPAAHRNPYDVAAELKADIRSTTGLKVTIGIGPNRMVAKLAAKDAKPDGIGVVKAGEEEAFMEDRLLSDVPGIGPRVQDLLRAVNVVRVRDLKCFPLTYLERIFGRMAPLIYERLRGRDPWMPPSVPRSISRETSFTRDTIDYDEVSNVLYYLTERACRTCRSLGLVAGRVQVKVRFGDETTQTASTRLASASASDRVIYEAAARLLARLRRRCRVHLVGVCLSDLLPGDVAQTSLLENLNPSHLDSLYRTLDAIRDRFGHSAVIVGRSINLIGQLERDAYGFILRTPSLTK